MAIVSRRALPGKEFTPSPEAPAHVEHAAPELTRMSREQYDMVVECLRAVLLLVDEYRNTLAMPAHEVEAAQKKIKMKLHDTGALLILTDPRISKFEPNLEAIIDMDLEFLPHSPTLINWVRANAGQGLNEKVFPLIRKNTLEAITHAYMSNDHDKLTAALAFDEEVQSSYSN